LPSVLLRSSGNRSGLFGARRSAVEHVGGAR
jgi:hypothetical protein